MLIISPNFPPQNSADMHRVRQSLPYFRQYGWEPVVITVDEAYAEAYSKDDLLLHTIPDDIEVHRVKALPVKYTRKFGMGSLSMRAYWHIKKKGNELLSKNTFQLVYFSTTAFHVMALGPVWKRKFKVPFILDMQDPWRNDFYLSKPAAERPPKFFIAYNIDKYLEAKTAPLADGIISVSQSYCDTFMERYPSMKKTKMTVIPFGGTTVDFDIMHKYISSSQVKFDESFINFCYIGRGGHDLDFALAIIFGAFAKGLQKQPELFEKIRFWFIGTSYAVQGSGKKTIVPIAEKFAVEKYVTEITDRLPYFESLYVLQKANVLLVPGSTDTAYTASKIYPYILTGKNILAVFHKNSSVLDVLKQCRLGSSIAFDHQLHEAGYYTDEFCRYMEEAALNKTQINTTDVLNSFEPYSARARTKEQTDFFNKVIAV